jgi:hypothetical protein
MSFRPQKRETLITFATIRLGNRDNEAPHMVDVSIDWIPSFLSIIV